MSGRNSHLDYLPAAGKDWLLPLYDPLQRLFRAGGLHREMFRLADLRPGHRVLDVGCGTGNLLCALGRSRADVELTGLDPDPKALARAQRKATRAGLMITWERGYAQRLPFPDGAFDRVLSSLMFHHLEPEDRAGMLAEVRRVLRPDGVLVLADLGAPGGGHGHGHGFIPRRLWRTQRMHENVGETIPALVEAAGLHAEPTVAYPLRGMPSSIVVARAA